VEWIYLAEDRNKRIAVLNIVMNCGAVGFPKRNLFIIFYLCSFCMFVCLFVLQL